MTDANLHRLPIRTRRGVVLIDLLDVDWIAAAGNYVELHVGDVRYLYRSTLTALHERLDPEDFARIHRSRIVNLSRVKRVDSITNGDAHLHLRCGRRLRLSRRFRSELEQRLPLR